MKKLFLSLLTSVLAGAASGQTGDDLVSAATDRERLLINAERLAQEAAFDVEEAACYKKFFVNRCLNAIKPRRNEVMTDLNRREIALNELKRKQKAAEQMRKIEEKSSPEVLQQAAERRTKSLADEQARIERSQKKADERIDLQQNEAQRANEAASKLQGSQERAQARIDKQATIAEEVKKYNEKQQQVMERKANQAKRQSEQTKPPAQPLPTPN